MAQSSIVNRLSVTYLASFAQQRKHVDCHTAPPCVFTLLRDVNMAHRATPAANSLFADWLARRARL